MLRLGIDVLGDVEGQDCLSVLSVSAIEALVLKTEEVESVQKPFQRGDVVGLKISCSGATTGLDPIQYRA